MDCEKIINSIRTQVKDYIVSNNIKSLVIGISGGIDSTVNAAMLKPICDELNIPLIGRFINIESNKQNEIDSAKLVGNAFCTKYSSSNLLMPFLHLFGYITKHKIDNSIEYKIRKGNVKARIRMLILRDMAQENHGIMIDNSNFTEFNLGFFTIADNGDLSPMKYLWKTEVYEIAHFLSEEFRKNGELKKKEAIDFSISLTPTDGLGITNSDLEQIGAESYQQVDDILKVLVNYKPNEVPHNELIKLNEKHTETIVTNVFNRWKNSEYKRNGLPINIKA